MSNLIDAPVANPMTNVLPAHWPIWTPADVAADGADAHWTVLEGERPLARASLWWSHVPALDGQRVGLIGHFAAVTQEAAHQLLEHACAELRANGCTMAVGPMDGNTLRRYRLLTERGPEPPFIMEPDNPDDWPRWWTASGFAPLAKYYSGITEDLTQEDERIAPARVRLAGNGIVIRPMGADYRADLRAIYEVAHISFANNFLASPFTEDEFLVRYLPFEQLVKREFVLIAEHDDRPVGFMFCIPDYAQAERGEPITTIVMKTFAVLPGRTYAGLGTVLLANCTRFAAQVGYQKSIHALMYEHNNSLLISARTTRVFRRYTLFVRELGP